MHYTLLVITSDGDYDDALAPYSEHISVEPYVEYTPEEAVTVVREFFEAREWKEDERRTVP